MLSQPLIVEAAETLFVPVCVHNNSKDDADAGVLKEFEEPAWNNPVVRILAPGRKDLVPRIAKEWTAVALLDGMVQALEAGKAQVPSWLRMIRDEQDARRRGLERAVFAMG